MATRIGVSNFHYALMKTEDTLTTPPTYDKPVSSPGVMSININPNASIDTLFADDGPFETATTIGQVEVELQKAALTTSDKAALLGKTVDSKGGLISSSTDIPPWVGISFKSLKSNGNYRYCWLYKGKFTDPEDNNETKGDSINWQSDTITGNFARLVYEATVDGKKKSFYKYEMDEDDTDIDENTVATWFDAVVFPTEDTPAGPTGQSAKSVLPAGN